MPRERCNARHIKVANVAARRLKLGISTVSRRFLIAMDWQETIEAARSHYDAGRFRQALMAFRQSAADLEAAGENGIQLVETLRELARTLRRLAQYGEAEDLLKKILPAMAELHGEEAVETSRLFEELGLVYIEQSRYTEAEEALEKSFSIRSIRCGSNSIETAETHNDVGLLAWGRGDDARAKKNYETALEIRRAAYGDKHPLYAETLDNLGALYQRLHRFDDAEKCHTEALRIREERLGVEHPEVGDSLVNLAEVYREQGRHSEIEQLLMRAIWILEKSLGDSHHNVAVAINNLGGYYLEQGELEKALPLFERAVELTSRTLGEDNTALLPHLHNLATVYRQQNKADEWRSIEERIQKLFGEKLSSSGGTQHLLLQAHSLQNERDYDAAALLLGKALYITQEEFGVDSLKAAQILDFLGSNSFWQKDLEKARNYFSRSLMIRNSNKGSEVDVAAVEQTLLFLQALQEEKEALMQESTHPESEKECKSAQPKSSVQPIRVGNYKRIVVLTGAGISAASGLRTYRGPDGLWEEKDTARMSQKEILETEPEAVWNFFGYFREKILQAKPNAAHIALAECEKQLPSTTSLTILTQNIDGLHQRAGSTTVAELHGSLLRSRCSNRKCSLKAYEDTECHLDRMPICKKCNSMIRPDIVLFGEELSLDAEHLAKKSLRDCDLFFAIGTSGIVQPACSFVEWAKYAGAHTVLVNLEPMEIRNRAFDQEILGRAEEVLPLLFDVK